MKDEVKIILDICDKILLKNVDHHLRLNLEPNSTQFKTLKDEIISSELTKLLVKEDLGGAGMTLNDIIPIVQLSAQYGTPIPFIETIISNFLLSELNIKPENDFITLTNKTENIIIKKDKISGTFKSIPYLNLAEKILVETEIKNQKYIILFKKGGKLKLQKNFLSEPKFDLDAAELEIISMTEKPEQMDIQNLLINVRSIQSFGAMEKILKLCIEYCSQRKQFGRTLSKFQMIQNHISEIALEVAASGASLSTLKNNNKIGTVKKNSITRSQDTPDVYLLNSIIGWRTNYLLKVKNLFSSKKNGLWIMDENKMFDIDTLTDYKIVKLLMRDY